MPKLAVWHRKLLEELGQLPDRNLWYVTISGLIRRHPTPNSDLPRDCPLTAIARSRDETRAYSSGRPYDAGRDIGLSETRIALVAEAADYRRRTKCRPLRRAMLAALALEDKGGDIA